MKRFDPAEFVSEQHFRVAELAKQWAVGENTVRRLIRNNPRVRWLPKTGKQGRTRRTPLIPLSVAKEIYTEMMR